MNRSSEDLKHIRSMMERSTKFLSLSGLSGISAGIVATIGAYIANLMIEKKFSISEDLTLDLFLLALTIIFLASSLGFYFSLRKARKSNSKLWMPATLQIFKDFSIPMIVGGLLCLIMIYQQASAFIAPLMLIFYGLALIYAGTHTYGDIKVFGACEIILGLLAAIFICNGLLFWTIGFGVLHIVYGTVMYWKYDRPTKAIDQA